jgi:putative membrane protein
MAGSQPPAFTDLTSGDLEAIREATQTAELRTGGELVCVLVGRCDSYPGSHWKGATLGAIAGTAAAAIWLAVGQGWRTPSPYLLPLATLAFAAAGLLAVAALPMLRRLLVPAELLDLRVDRRAAAAFLSEEVFATRDRTGVLLFVAFFEHRVRILADSGVRQLVEPGVWESIAGELTRGIRAGRTRDALIAAIDACGAALETHRVVRRPDDQNELGDEPRVLDD